MLKHVFFFSIIIVTVSLSMGCEGCNGGNHKVDNGVDVEVDNGNANTSETPDTNEQVSQNGFKFIHHIKNDGPKPQPGEYAYFDVEMYGVIDSLNQSSFLEASQQFSKIMPIEDTKGFTNPILDVLYYMSVGDSVSVKMPPKILETIQPEYLDFSYLRLQIKLTGISSPEVHSKSQIEKFNKRKETLIKAQANLEKFNSTCKKMLKDYRAGTIANLVEKESGLKYVIVEEGKGKTLKKGISVNLFYAGYLMDGTVFENTFESGLGTTIQVGKGQALPGWEEAFTYFNFGTKAYLFIPYPLAYGNAGNPPLIPPRSDVMFYIELME